MRSYWFLSNIYYWFWLWSIAKRKVLIFKNEGKKRQTISDYLNSKQLKLQLRMTSRPTFSKQQYIIMLQWEGLMQPNQMTWIWNFACESVLDGTKCVFVTALAPLDCNNKEWLAIHHAKLACPSFTTLNEYSVVVELFTCRSPAKICF